MAVHKQAPAASGAQGDPNRQNDPAAQAGPGLTKKESRDAGYRRTRFLGTALTWGIAAGLISCGSSGGEDAATAGLASAPLNILPNADDDGEVTETQNILASGPIVGAIEMEAPAESSFIVRATMPVPPDTYHPRRDDPPFSVVNRSGHLAPTQVEVVSMYADPAQGADVVELIARVRRPQNVAPGSRLRFEVAHEPHEAKDLDLLPPVRNFFSGSERLRLQTRDVFGHLYTADLFRDVIENTGEMLIMRRGELVKEFRTHEILLPETSTGGNQGTMPHLMGVHSFITFYENEPFFTLDLHVHNGLSGLDQADPTDDALREIYFDALELRMPQGWRVQEAFDSPFAGPGRADAGHRVYPLVRAQANGNMHVMPTQSRMVRRLVISLTDNMSHARSVVEARHQAFCVRGFNDSGQEYYSWWNRDTARYYPQKHRLPSLDHVGLAGLRQNHLDRLEQIAGQVASGSDGPYPFTESSLGWAHPWGSPYGGITGGDEIWLFDGVETAAAASNPGFRQAQLVSRLYTDRQPIALFNGNGDPTRDIDWVRPEGLNGPWMPMYFFLRPLPNNDPFGFEDAPTHQTQAVAQQGRRPGYQDRLSSFQAIDLQHFIRYTRNLKTLTWLGNDSLSKLDLQLATEMFRLGFHMYPNSNYNHVQNSGLLARTLWVQEYPGQGMGFGRGESWGLDTAIAAYATSRQDFRDRYYPWFEIVAQLVEDGQSTCNGFIQAWQSNNYLGAEYRLRQSYETAITENMLRGMTETIFRGTDEDRTERLEQIMLRSAEANTSAPYWDEQAHAPWNFMAVGPYSNDEPLYCGNVPDEARSPNHDRFQYWSSLAYAYEISGNEMFLFRAAEMSGGGDLLNQLIGSGTGNLGNRAALIALIQEIRGID